MEVKKSENKLVEENIKKAKLENKLMDYKEKSAMKIANILQKYEFLL